MEEIKNKIITLSGEPVSGKGTVAKALKQKLIQEGYEPEKIHMKSTGDEFRKYFTSVVELIINFDNPKREEIARRPEIKALFENVENRRVISKTIASLAEKKIDLSHFTIEDANNSAEFEDIRSVIDHTIDEEMKKEGIKINSESHPDEAWIIDSRLAFSNVQGSFDVRLTANPRIAGERLFNDKSRGKEDRYTSLEEAIKEREDRRTGEIKRYKKVYGVDISDEENYSVVIDTSYSSPDSIADVILECSDRFQKGEDFARNWASPKVFIPKQDEMDTLRPGMFGKDIGEMTQLIEENGYYPDSPIETVSVDGILYIIEGHHRNFGAARAGKELIPYEIMAKDDEKNPELYATPRKIAEYANMAQLFGHEGLLDKLERKTSNNPNARFSYEKIHPELVGRLTEKYKKEIAKREEER